MEHIFIDFEMTCWFNKRNSKGKKVRKIPEIIEIGAVKLDENFQMIDTFSIYVKPQLSKTISKECTELTGITMENLEDAPLLEEALIMFEDWINSDNVKIYAWSTCDQQQLQKECYQKRLYKKLPKQYARWLDLQAIFMRVFNITNQRLALSAAMGMTGLGFEGTQHRAVNDAINGARLLAFLKSKDGKYLIKKQELHQTYKERKSLSINLGELFAEKLALLQLVS